MVRAKLKMQVDYKFEKRYRKLEAYENSKVATSTHTIIERERLNSQQICR